MIPKSEYQLILDPELNEGNKFPGIKDLIEEAQSDRRTEVVFATRIIVHKKLADFFEGNPYQYKFTFDNSGLDSQHRGLIKVTLI